MKKILVTAAIITVSIMVVLSIGGCKQKIAESLVEKAIEQAAAKEGESVDINLEEGQIKIKTEEGGEIELGGASIPEGWPSEVPVNDNIEIQFSGKEKTDNKWNYHISGTYSGSGEDLYNYYKQNLSGWNAESDSVTDMGDEGKSYSLQVSNDKYYVSLFIVDGKDNISVILTVNEK